VLVEIDFWLVKFKKHCGPVSCSALIHRSVWGSGES